MTEDLPLAAYSFRQALAAVVALGLFFQVPCRSEGESNANRLKQYLAHPPVISDCVYQITEINRTADHTNVVVRLANVRWQPDCLFYRELDRPESLDDREPGFGRALLSRFHAKYWIFTTDARFLTFADARSNKNIPALELQPFRLCEARMSWALLFGIGESEIQGLRWEGDNVAPFRNYSGNRVRGELLTKEGTATGLELQVKAQGGQTYNWQSQYEYPPNDRVPSFLPSVIRVNTSWGDQPKRPRFVIRILSLSTNSMQLGEDQFSLESFVNPTVTRILWTNNVQMAVDPLSRGLVAVGGAPRSRWLRIILWCGFVLLNLFFLVSLARKVIKQKQRGQTHK